MIDFLCFLPLPRFRPARLPNQLLRAQDSTEHDSSTRLPGQYIMKWTFPAGASAPPIASGQHRTEIFHPAFQPFTGCKKKVKKCKM